MKMNYTVLVFITMFTTQLQAQTFNNLYDDAKALKGFYSGNKLDPAKSADWIPILQRYLPTGNPGTYANMISEFDGNPFGLNSSDIIPANLNAGAPPTVTAFVNIMSINTFSALGAPTTTQTASTTGSGGLTVSAAADAVAQLIIERGKEELTVTFFAQLKTQLKDNPELNVAFPKTTAFIDEIESYLYASYLTTLREAFAEDIANLPFNLGPILRTDRIKKYLAAHQNAGKVWLVAPVFHCLGDLHKGKSLPDALEDLYPDNELNGFDSGAYNTLKLLVILSQAIRDSSGKQDFIDYAKFNTDIIGDAATAKIFFGLLYQSTKYMDGMNSTNAYITPANQVAIEAIVKALIDGYITTKSAITNIKTAANNGKAPDFPTVLNLLNNPVSELSKTITDINALLPHPSRFLLKSATVFQSYPDLLVIVNNCNDKKYASGIMNSMILIDKLVPKGDAILAPFDQQPYLERSAVVTGTALQVVKNSLVKLKEYQLAYPEDDITKKVKSLNKLANQINITASAAQVSEIQKLFGELQTHTYKFNADDVYRKLLKYGTLMANLSNATTSADVTAALDAAILPTGSSSIKYSTAFSFSLNSYIGASYYREYYGSTAGQDNIHLNTAGVALPIGLNVSASTRGKIVGAISLFVSAVDLGAIASYRLSDPKNVNSQPLPDFTWQNLLAPGGYIVLGRLFKTPLAFGVGAQKGPQLRKITEGTTDISQNQNWRFGAFLSVDIPLFNFYSKSLRKPLP